MQVDKERMAPRGLTGHCRECIMITYLNTSLFSSPARDLVNTVNTHGVMGKGLALEFKTRYPKMFKEYVHVCQSGKFTIGMLHIWRGGNITIINFPTKRHWRDNSKLEYIEKGLQAFCNTYQDYDIQSVAFPKLGCGLGNLEWDQVRPVMEQYLKELPIEVYIHV